MDLAHFFQSLARKAIPLLKEGAKTAGKAALSKGLILLKMFCPGTI